MTSSGSSAICSACGSPAAGTAFCVNCGARQQVLDVSPDDVSAAVGPACSRCGAALAPGLRFCTECGSPAAPAAAPAPRSLEPVQPPVMQQAASVVPPAGASAPAYAGVSQDHMTTDARAPRARRRTAAVAASGLLTTVLLGGGGVAAWWFLMREDPGTSAKSAQSQEPTTGSDSDAAPAQTDTPTPEETAAPATDTPDEDPGATQDPQEPEEAQTTEAPEPSAAASPTETATPARWTCWDETVVRKVDNCSLPSGTRGLEWVFPDFNSSQCRQVLPSNRVQEWECTLDIPRYGRGVVRYSEYSPSAFADQFGRLNDKWPGTTTRLTRSSSSTRYVWEYSGVSENAPMTEVTSWLYADHPYSVSIEADTRSTVTRILEDHNAWRDPAEMRGVPS